MVIAVGLIGFVAFILIRNALVSARNAALTPPSPEMVRCDGVIRWRLGDPCSRPTRYSGSNS